MTSIIKRSVLGALQWLRLSTTLLAAAWCTLCLHFNSLLPSLLATVLAIGYSVFVLVHWRRSENWGTFYKLFVPVSLVVFVLWCFVRPTHEPTTTKDGGWSRLHAVMPQTDFADSQVLIHNVRKTEYNADGSYIVHHNDRTFDLGELDSVWFGEQHFASFQGLAHTFVSFGFADGQYVSISAEARRGEGEGFSPLRGSFKQFGLIYVVSTEEDAIGRTLSENMPIYLYPIRASHEQIQSMFLHMLHRANELHEQPEFYHTVHNNCASNIVDSFNAIAPIHFSQYSPFLALPGYSGKVAYHRGLIDTKKEFSVVQQQARINELALKATPDDFSTQIRANFESPGRAVSPGTK